MKKLCFVLYFMAFSIPLLLGLVVWQSTRYQSLYLETLQLDQVQIEWVESNRRLIANIAENSSPERINRLAQEKLNLQKIQPELMLQVKITGAQNEF